MQNRRLTDYQDPTTKEFDMRGFARDLIGFIRTNTDTHPMARMLNGELAGAGLPPMVAVTPESEQILMDVLDRMLSLYPRPITDLEVAQVVAKFISEFIASFDGTGYIVQHGQEMKKLRGAVSPAALMAMPAVGNA